MTARRCLPCALAAALAALHLGCGSKSSGVSTMPTLPGDGDSNNAVPPPAEPPPPPPAPADPWSGRTDLIAAPAAKPPAEVNLPAITRFTLANGLEVIVVPNHDLPVVSLSIAIKTGRADEPRDKIGVASFTTAMLTAGTRSRSAEKIAETIDFAGGDISASSSLEASFVTCSVLAKDLKTCLTLLPDVTLNPTFPESELREKRDALLSQVKQRKDDAEQLAAVHFQNALWGDDHSRGWVMSEQTLGRIGRADLVAWHKAWFKPNNAIMAVAGDVDPKALRAALERSLGGWKKGELPARADTTDPALHGIKVRLVDKPDQTQSQIRLGHLGLSHRDEDFFAAVVMNYSLGGGLFASRLMKVVRSEGGKTYLASSSFERNLARGAFAISTFTRNAETVATIKLLIGELAKMAASGPTQEELVDAKTNLTGSYSTQFESSAAIASSLLAAELHGYDEGYVRTYALKIGAVTLEQARAAAAKRLDPNDLVIVIVGAAKDVEPQLKAAGWTYDKVDYMAPVAKYERDRLAADQNAPVDAAAEAAARKVLDQALAAKGGAKKLLAMKNMVMEGELKVNAGGQSFDAKVKRTWVAPDKMRLDMVIPAYNVTIATAVTAKAGWNRQAMGANEQVTELSGADLEDARAQFWRDQETVLLRHTEKGTVVRPHPDETIEGVDYYVVTVARADGKVAAKLFIDKKTKLLGRMTYQEGGSEALEVFTDYRSVNGIQVAHKRHTEGAQGALDSMLSSVTFNVKVDDSIFDKPAGS